MSGKENIFLRSSKADALYLLAKVIEKYPNYVRDISDFQFDQIVGKGGFGEVWRAHDLRSGRIVAVKELQADKITTQSISSFIREIQSLILLQETRFIVPFIGFTAEPPYSIITEYLPNKSLYTYIKFNPEFKKSKSIDNLNNNAFGEDTMWFSGTHLTIIAMCIAWAMNSMNEIELIHRDLKASNILFDKNFFPQICDFGTTRAIATNKRMTGRIGTITHMAPEVYLNKKYDNKCDIYSYAMVLFEMSQRRSPYRTTKSKMIEKIKNGERPKFDLHTSGNQSTSKLSISTLASIKKSKRKSSGENNWSKNWTPICLRELIERCWQEDFSKRPSFIEIYEMFKRGEVYFRGTDLKKVARFAEELEKTPERVPPKLCSSPFIKSNEIIERLRRKFFILKQQEIVEAKEKAKNRSNNSNKLTNVSNVKEITNNQMNPNNNNQNNQKNNNQKTSNNINIIAITEQISNEKMNQSNSQQFKNNSNENKYDFKKGSYSEDVYNYDFEADRRREKEEEEEEYNDVSILDCSKTNSSIEVDESVNHIATPFNRRKSITNIDEKIFLKKSEVLSDPTSSKFNLTLQLYAKHLEEPSFVPFYAMLEEYIRDKSVFSETVKEIILTFKKLGERKPTFFELLEKNHFFSIVHIEKKELTQTLFSFVWSFFKCRPDLINRSILRVLGMFLMAIPEQCIHLFEICAEKFYDIDDPLMVFDFLLIYQKVFIDDSFGAKFVDLLLFLVIEYREFREYRLKNVVEIITHFSRSCNFEVAKSSMVCLTHLIEIYPKMEVPFVVICRNLNNKYLVKPTISLLLRVEHFPSSSTFCELLTNCLPFSASVFLMFVGEKEENALIAAKHKNWLKNMSIFSLKIFMVIYQSKKARHCLLSQSPEDFDANISPFFAALPLSQNNEILIVIASLLRMMNLRQTEISSLTKNNFFKNYYVAVVNSKDVNVFAACNSLLDSIARSNYSKDFALFVPLLMKHLSEKSDITTSAITVLVTFSFHHEMNNILKNKEFFSYFTALRKTSFKQQADKFIINVFQNE